MRRFAIAAAASTAALSSFALGGSLAHAEDAPTPPAPDAVSKVTLPLLGSPLVVDITTDAGGGLLDVTLTPSTGFDPTDVDAGKVRFANEAGGVTLKVSARHGGERVSAHAGSLADISGAGQWSGDVFDSGDTTTVDFTIAAGADGGPDITGITVTSPLANTVGEVVRSSGGDDEQGDDNESEQSAKVTIEFSDSGQTRFLTIKAVLETEDGETHAALKISLSRVKGALLAEGPAVGPHSWSGQLCDGSAASFTYNVSASGEITDVVATPPAGVSVEDGHARVAFSDHERVSISVDGEGDEMTVGTRERIRCDRVDPTVNGQVVDVPDDEGDDHESDDQGDDNDDQGEDHDGDHAGAPDDDHDDDHDGDHRDADDDHEDDD